MKTLSDCSVILSKPTVRTDNGKAALTIRNPNAHFSQLTAEFVDNSNICAEHIGQKGLHLNKFLL